MGLSNAENKGLIAPKKKHNKNNCDRMDDKVKDQSR